MSNTRTRPWSAKPMRRSRESLAAGERGDNAPVSRSDHLLRGPVVALILLLASGASAIAALPDPLVLERLGRERGFPSETITAIHRDRSGFLWVGSREGLARWDGYEVEVFQHAVSDPSSLSDDAVRRIYEDRSGRLWVGTDAGGLQRLDLATGKFESFRHDPEDPHSLDHDGVYAIVQGDGDELWVGTQQGLNRLDPDSGYVERFAADPEDPAALPHPWIYDLFRDRAGRIWVATVGGGVAWIDPHAGRFTRVPFGESAQATDRSTLTYSIVEGPSGEVWVGAEDGVFRYDTATASLERVPVIGLRGKEELAIVTAIAFDGSGTLWATTWNGGLLGYETATGMTRNYHHDPAREDGLSTDRLACLFIDPGGEVWIGSWGGGVQRFSSEAGMFTMIRDRGTDPAGLPYREVTSVLDDGGDRLWVGTWGRGLCWGSGNGGPFFCNQRADLLTPLSIAEGEGGDVWVGTMSGLYRVSPQGEIEESYTHAAQQAEGLGVGYVNAVAFDHDGRLWIGTGGGGLHERASDGGTFDHFRNDPLDPSSLGGDHVTSLRVAADGGIWVGTRSAGLNRLDPATGRFTRFVPEPDDPHSLGHHTVTSILEDRQGRIWAGTAGGGIARIERGPDDTWRVTRVGVAEGLVNASVVSIQEDDDGSLWIGTRRGLSRYQPDTGKFHNYGAGDGLPSLEFRPNASAASATHLYFGTLGGVLIIGRGSRFEPAAPTPTMITGIRSLDGPWPLSEPAWETREIEAPYGTMLSVEFDVLDLRPPHQFAYRLEGDREPWIDLGRRREITFAGLNPGSYSLSVRGLNARGVWSESAFPLRIAVLPPYWMTWWFRGVLLVGILGLAWAGISARMNALARRNRELEALHHEREAALAQVSESQQELHGAYERLRRLTRRLEEAQEEERRRIARELHDEMGQALSAVKINLKALDRLSRDAVAGERVGDALTLVDGIIGHVRALSLDLRPPLLDELGLVAALRGYAEGQTVRSGVEISVEANSEVSGIPSEIAITAFRIVQESVHNVLRHAEGARKVTVSVRRDPGRISVTVRDDGQGFDLTAALDRAAKGRHLGLLGMRERVEALGGSFEIETGPGRGTVVHATIPLEEKEVTP